MDSKDVIELILAIIGGSGGLLAIFNLVVRANISRKQNDADWIRDQVFTPDKYEVFRKNIVDEVRREMEADFKIRLEIAVEAAIKPKDELIATLNDKVRTLESQLADLGHRVGNVEQAEQFRKDGLTQ